MEDELDAELGAADAEAEAESSLLADALPMLRFLMLCDVWRWRLDCWSRSGSAATGGGATGSTCLVELVEDETLLGTPLLSRAPLRQRLRQFDGTLIEMGEAVAHLFASATTPSVLWAFFLYRLGDPATPEFTPKLPPHSESTANPLELLRPPRLKADPSLLEVARIPRLVLKSAAARAAATRTSRGVDAPTVDSLPGLSPAADLATAPRLS